MPYVKVSTSASGAWTVQLATKRYGKSVILRHIGSAHTPDELKRLKAVARQELERPALGQTDLFTTRLDLDRVRVVSHKPEYLERIIAHYYNLLGFSELGHRCCSIWCSCVSTNRVLNYAPYGSWRHNSVGATRFRPLTVCWLNWPRTNTEVERSWSNSCTRPTKPTTVG